MNKLCYSRWKRVQVVNLLVMSLAIPEVAAQETEMEGPVELEEMAESEELGELEEMVVVGSRHHARSVAESPVPVDVIPQDYFHSQGYSDMHTALSLMIPSYNVNVQPVSAARRWFARRICAGCRGIPLWSWSTANGVIARP